MIYGAAIIFVNYTMCVRFVKHGCPSLQSNVSPLFTKTFQRNTTKKKKDIYLIDLQKIKILGTFSSYLYTSCINVSI